VRVLGFESEISGLDREADETLRAFISILEEPTPDGVENKERFEMLSAYGIREAQAVLSARAASEGAGPGKASGDAPA
jgi:hypothetical protein